MNELAARQPGMRKIWGILAVLIVLLVAGLRSPALSAASNSFHLVEGWPQVPPSVPMGFIAWVAADHSGLVYVFRRCPIKCSDDPHPGPNDPPGTVLLFDAPGKYMREWEPKSGGKWKEAHALYIDKKGFIWTTDVQLNVVRKYRADGTLVMTLGKVGVAGETTDTFNKPTNVFVTDDGTIFVTDGYGNQRVVKLTSDGKFIKAWGKKGTGPGEFRIPHAVAQDKDGRIIIADRCGLGATKCTDGRVQVFDTDGNFLTQWTAPNGKLAPFAVSVDTSNRLYIDDTQNTKVWILDAKSLKVIDTVEGASGHGMTVSPNGDDIYLTASKAGICKYTRSK